MEKKYEELEIVSEEYVKEYLEKMQNSKQYEKAEYKKVKIDIKYPLYLECFKNALSSILTNLDRINVKCKKEYKDDEDYRYSVSRLPDNANNIYAFLGGRGSGKTTAINEFGESLKHFDEISGETEWIKEVKGSLDLQITVEKLKFTVLDAIDASLLTDKEDFVELVLAQLFGLIEEKRRCSAVCGKQQNSHTIAELMDAFFVAYNSYHNISREETGRELGESVANILKNMPSGPNARWAISQLLKKFFDFIGTGEKAEWYLVITIDDLDLNINYGYKLLEQIHKYLSDPRIIVLIAADYGQLSHVCEYYLKNQYAKNGEKDDWDSAIELSKAYLLKEIPISNRIYMPDNRDFAKSYVVENKSENAFVRNIKSFIIDKMVQKLGIYYDMNGSKKHFAIPETIREFVNYNDFLDSLDFFGWREGELPEERMDLYDQNHAEMNQDIVNRMAFQLLSHKQQKVFHALVEKNILKRGRYTVDLCYNWIEEKSEDRIDSKKYHYTDLLEGIYKLGRHNYHDKALVHCMIAFFTSEMTREYYNLQCENKKAAQESKQRLQEFLGESFGNKWLAEMVPKVIVDKGQGLISEWGYVENAQISLWELKNSFMISEQREGLSEQVIFDQLIDVLKRDRCFEILGMFMMLFTEYRISGIHVSLPEIRFKILESSDWFKMPILGEELEYSISFGINTATFDVFGFIGKEWDGEQIEEITNGIVEKIVEEVEGFVKEKRKIQEEGNKKTIYNRLKKIVKQQISKWMDGNFLAFPFYSLDMAYNVLKRARNRGCYEEGRIQLYQIYDTMRSVYGYIAAELYLEDQIYEENKIEGQHWHDRFVKSPFIKNFGITYPKEILSRDSKLKNIGGSMSEEMKKELERMIKVSQMPVITDDTPN